MFYRTTMCTVHWYSVLQILLKGDIFILYFEDFSQAYGSRIQLHIIIEGKILIQFLISLISKFENKGISESQRKYIFAAKPCVGIF